MKSVLFDMDGVLFDSMPGHAFAWLRAMQRFGLTMTREEVYMNEGRTGHGTINILNEQNYRAVATKVSAIAVPNVPGGLSSCARLRERQRAWTCRPRLCNFPANCAHPSP